jgi:type IV secretory pathway VirB2 component (pilin)
MIYHLDGKRVNRDTMVVSLVLRLVVLLLGIALIAGATPLSFGQVFGVVVGLLLIWGAKTIVLTFTD